MNVKSENYINIQGWMRTELNLNGNDLLVYAIIYQFSQDGESKFTGSLQYLADWCGATKQGIQKNLKNLTDKGLIKAERIIIHNITTVVYYTTELHTIQLSCMNNKVNSINNSSNIINSNNQQELFTDNTSNNNKEDTYKEKVQKFVDDFNDICKSLPKCTKITLKRGNAIVKLLKAYDYDEILTVFNKLEESDFCTNRKGSGWKANIDFILREDKFVATLEGKYDNQKKRNNVETISAGNKRHISEEEREEMRKAVERGDLEVF